MAAEGIDVSVLEKESIKKRGRKKRTMRISKKLATDKETYIRKKSLGVNGAEMTSKEGNAKTSQEQVVSNKGPGSSSHNSQVQQASTPSDEYMTAEENVGRTGDEMEDDERGEMDDDGEERESGGEDSEDGDGEDIESRRDREEEELGSEEEEDEYDSDTTDIVDPATYFKPLSRHQSRS